MSGAAHGLCNRSRNRILRSARPAGELYVAAEDPHGMRQRIRALREELGDTPDLEMAEGLSDFMTPDGPHTAALEDRITEFGPAVQFIDTIAASFRGLKENDSGNEGMGAVGPQLPPQPLFALRILNDLIVAEGKPLPTGAGFPYDKLRGVLEDRWRAECDTRRLSAAEEQEDRKRVFRNVFQKLQRFSVVAARDGWVWPVRLSPDDSREG